MLTVRSLLAHPCFTGACLAAGSGGMDRTVEWASTVEILDDLQKVHQGELVITTAYGWGSNTWAPEEIVLRLVQRRAAALAIQLGIYLKELPKVVIEEADRLMFPVITIPGHLTFREISIAIAEGRALHSRKEEPADRTDIPDFNAKEIKDDPAVYEAVSRLGVYACREVLERVLGSLIRYDGAHKAALVDTLTVYLEENCKVSLTARRTGLHRHTVSYRINKIREITGRDPDKYCERLDFEFALLIHKVYDK